MDQRNNNNATVGKSRKTCAVMATLFLFLTLISTTSTASAAYDDCHSTSEVVGLTHIPKNESNCYKADQSEDELNVAEAEAEVNRVKRGLAFYKTGKALASLASQALDNLLQSSGYDKRIRPQVGGAAVPVTINLSIRSMGPVSEDLEAYSLDCYFRQSWVDDRLKFNATNGVNELALNWAFLAKIWVPDTYVINGKDSYLHKITVPNRFVRIAPDGRVSYSQRLTLWAACKMDLASFPLDTQMCPLYFGSFGYDSKDVLYHWQQPKSVSIDKLGLAQFHLTTYRSSESVTQATKRRTRESIFRNDSIATLEFFFERQRGFFLLQIYFPLTLIVFCSWVTFWLVKTEKGGEVPARTALGANAVLSIVNIGFGGKSRPQVGYATALDVFIILCFVVVFASLLEFASIVFLDAYVKRRKKREEEMEAKKLERIKANKASKVNLIAMSVVPIVDATATVDVNAIQVDKLQAEEDDDEDYVDVDEEEALPEPEHLYEYIDRCLQFISDKTESFMERRFGPINQMQLYTNTFDTCQAIDRWSRRLFPLAFLILNLFYWMFYLA